MARKLLQETGMLTVRLPLLASCSILFLCLASGCSGAGRASSVDTPTGEVHRPPDGVIQVAEASRPFINVEPVAVRESAAVLRAPARVAFRDGAVAKLGAPLAGRVERVHVRTGDRVQSGDPLVTLDCPDAASSRAALSTARAAQSAARAGVERQNRMLEQGVGTERERLEAERSLAEAEAELARAQAAVRFVGNGQGTTVVIRSPIAGTVVSRNATVGAAVESGGEPLVEVGDPSELWVVADVFERDLHIIRDGMRAQVELPSVREPLAGRVASIGAVVEGSARTAPVRISLEQKDEGLRPGMFGRARIESADQALALPTAAVLIKGEHTVVYVQTAPGTFTRRTVVVGHPVEGKVLVRSGISAGDLVVVRGALLLDGAADQLL
jgi:membrane fusion protein, heavy metal efflux system